MDNLYKIHERNPAGNKEVIIKTVNPLTEKQIRFLRVAMRAFVKECPDTFTMEAIKAFNKRYLNRIAVVEVKEINFYTI